MKTLAAVALLCASAAQAQVTIVNTGTPDGRMAMASRPGGRVSEIEAADDFVLSAPMQITGGSFIGLLPGRLSLSAVTSVSIEIYAVFPAASNNPPSGRVPTRVNSPSDVAIDSRANGSGLSFTTSVLSANFTAANSVLRGINAIPNQTTGGDGARSGQEVLFALNFTTPFTLAAGHYFFVPQVGLSTGEFYWLSAPKPIVAPGTPFAPDLQTWMRNSALDPDWLRVGTDIVGGATPPTFNGAFTLVGAASVPEPASLLLIVTGLGGLALAARRRRHV